MQNSFRGSIYQKYALNIVALYRQRKDVQNYLEITLSVVAISIFIILAIKPTLTTIGELITKIQVEQETSDKLDTKIKNLGIAQNLYNQNQDKINTLNSAVPNSADIANYMRQIEGIAKKDGLSITNVQAAGINLSNTATISATPKSLTSSILISGDYTNLESFIKDIESLRRPAIIIKMILELEKDTKTLNLTITPKAPYLE